MQLTYRVRAYPTSRQHALFEDYLQHTRQLYNAALQERVEAHDRAIQLQSWQEGPWQLCEKIEKGKKVQRWESEGKTHFGKSKHEPEERKISKADQSKSLTELRQDPEYAAYPRRMQRWAIDLVDAAYRGMFTRHRKGEKLGRPSYRGYLFWNTIGWDSPIDFRMRDRGIYGRKALGGTLRLRPDRELPPFDACTMFILCRDGNRWFAHLTYETPERKLKAAPQRPVGIDVGLKELVVRSDGIPMDAPRQSVEDTADRRRASRALSRCEKARLKRGRNAKKTKRHRKIRARLRKIDNRIARKRKAMLHKISARLTHHFDAVAVEDLNLKGLGRSGGKGAAGRGIRKSWRDRAPGLLFDMLKWKCQRDGRPYAAVDPRGTTIDCSACGAAVPKTTNDRVHICECGTVLGRDHNAAVNVLIRAGWGPGDADLGVSQQAIAGGAGLSRKHGKKSRTMAGSAAASAPSISLLRGGTHGA